MVGARIYPLLMRRFLRRLPAVCIAVSVMMASEYHGTVKAGSLPVPGVTVTAIRGDKKVTTTTDEHGVFSFADLPDGTWTLQVEMLGFAKLTREVGVAHDAPAPELQLTPLSEAELVASLEPTRAAPESAPAATPPTLGKPPAGASPLQRQGGFQRLNVNQTADTGAINNQGAPKKEDIADLNQSAANSLIVQGSTSSAADATGLPVQAPGMLFNTAAFSAPAAGQWGNAGRNTIPGPTTLSLNGSVGPIFRLGERHGADLQVQAQNMLNHVTITNWSTVLSSANYGLATTAAPMRRITVSLRFKF